MTTNITSGTPDQFKDEWCTPPQVVEYVRRLLGGIDFDTACTGSNAVSEPIWLLNASSKGFFSNDALFVQWRGRCFLNPPYSDINPWINHAIVCKDAITACLIPSPNGEDRFERLCANSHEIQIVGRLAFLAGGDYTITGKNGKPDKQVKKGDPVSGNTRGSSIFIINGYGKGSRSVVTREEIWRLYGEAK